jgi:hypothetical protein
MFQNELYTMKQDNKSPESASEAINQEGGSPPQLLSTGHTEKNQPAQNSGSSDSQDEEDEEEDA